MERLRTLEPCKAYRAWWNKTGKDQTRTVSVFPLPGEKFPEGVTVYVAPEGHTGEPPAASDPTKVGKDGDSIGKTVPKDNAVFVHLKEGSRPVKAKIDDGP